MSKKNRRTIFNQVIEVPEEKNEVVESTPIIIDPMVFETKLFVEEEPEIIPEDLVAEDEFITSEAAKERICDENCVCTDPCVEPCTCEEEKPVVKVPRTIESLSSYELKNYRRTGRLPD